jgi:hypothetical protein
MADVPMIDIAKIIVVTAGTAAIIYIGWREGWYTNKVGIICLFVAFYIMAAAAFPMPNPREWQVATTVAVLGIATLFAVWNPPDRNNIEKAIRQRINARRVRHEEVEYVPVTDDDTGGAAVSVEWVPE